jgi:hypothetical protein
MLDAALAEAGGKLGGRLFVEDGRWFWERASS